MKLRCLVLAFAFLFFGVSVVPMLAQAPPSGGGLVSGSSKISANSRENSNRTNGLRSRFSGVLQPIFLATPTYEVNGSGARSVVPADVNQDGAQDLVVTNNCDALCASGSVDVLLGVGDGTFQPAVSYDSGGFGTSSAAVGDLNGDGLPDVAVANTCAGDCTNGSVGVLLGIGNGAFAPVASYGSGGPSSDSVAVADVNQDGTTDLIVLNQGDSSVGILLGNGDGTFQPAVIYGAAGQAATSLAVADLNGDGKPDLVVASSLNSNYFLNGSVSVLLGNGNGTFQAAVPYDAGGQSTSSVAAADVNGDGKPDVLLANGAGSISVLLGNGDGTLQASLNSDSGAPAVSVAVADMNGDSKPDFLVATGVGLANVLLGNGDGTFQPGVGYGSGGLRAISVAAGDVNGDGNTDLLVANQCALVACTNASVGVLLGKGDGTLQGPASFVSGNPNDASVVARDLNNDGKPDLVIPNRIDGSDGFIPVVNVLLGNGDGTFQASVTYASGPQLPQGGLSSIDVADVNSDGVLDVVCANADGSVSVLLGLGDGTFSQSPANYYAGGFSPQSVTVADFNADGIPDVLVTNQFGGTYTGHGSVSLLLGHGDGTFSWGGVVDSGGSSATYVAVVAVTGLDGSSIPTALVANDDGTIGMFSYGASAAGPTVTGAVHARWIGVTDLDRNGYPNVIVANACADPTCATGSVIVGNLGDGFLIDSITLTPRMDGARSLALADFDGDGNLDIVSSAGNLLLLGNGDLTFQAPLKLGGVGPDAAIGDFNGDGTPDLAVVGGGVTILLNTRAATSTATTTAVTSSVNPTGFNQPVTFTATVTSTGSGTPSGTVTFFDGANSLGTGTLTSGVAMLSVSTLAMGTHSITASYGGDSHFLDSTSGALSQQVNTATTTTALTSTPNPSVVNQAVLFTASLVGQFGGMPTGTVSFKSGAKTLGVSTLTGGVATLSITLQTVGTRSVIATYSGDTNFATSVSATLKQFVSKAATAPILVSSLNPSNFGQSVTFTCNVVGQLGGTPTGTVNFLDGSTLLKTMTLSGGMAQFSTSSLVRGRHRIIVNYGGDGNFRPSSGNMTQIVR